MRAGQAARRDTGTTDRDELRGGRAHRGRRGPGVRRIVLGLGGVASTDGGAGMVQALGGVLLDHAGHDLPAGGAALAGLDRLDLAGLMPLGGIEVLVASDVDNPLLGRHGAAAVYGPQKGASPADLAILETGLARWADHAERAQAGPAAEQAGLPGPGLARRTGRTRDAPGAGAAGGLGFAALAFLGARIRPGIELMLDMISFTERLAGARLVITGEGSLDAQTLRGKAPAGVARAVAAARAAACPDAGAACLPVVAVAGTCTLTSAQLRRAGIEAAYALADIEPDVGRCLTHAGPLLEEAARRLAADWLPLRRGPGHGPAMTHDLVIRSRRVALPGGVQPAAVAVRQEKIAVIAGTARGWTRPPTTTSATWPCCPGWWTPTCT